MFYCYGMYNFFCGLIIFAKDFVVVKNYFLNFIDVYFTIPYNRNRNLIRTNLQGWVQFPTGGIAREPKGRSGQIPEPTVKSG